MNEIICADSRKWITTVDDASVDAIISDIPYGIGYEDWDVLHKNTNSAYGGSSAGQVSAGSLFKRRGKPLNGWSEEDKKIPHEYQQWCASWASDWLRVLKLGASCLIFAGRRFAHRCVAALEDSGFTFKEMLTWEKTKAPFRAQHLSAVHDRRGDTEDAAKWEGWRLANPRPLFEPILWFQKPYRTGGTIASNVLDYSVGAWNERALQTYSNIGSRQSCSNIIQVETNRGDSGLHPTQKPLSLMKCLVGLVTIENQLVVDPFAGSGTTCVAAKELGRNYIGVEVNPKVAEIAETRVNAIPEKLS